MSNGHQLDEVLVTRFVFREQCQMIRRIAAAVRRTAIFVRARRNISLHTNDWLYACLDSLLVKLVTATAGIPYCFTFFIKAGIRVAPSSREYSL
jgi:hypothetical protein